MPAEQMLIVLLMGLLIVCGPVALGTIAVRCRRRFGPRAQLPMQILVALSLTLTVFGPIALATKIDVIGDWLHNTPPISVIQPKRYRSTYAEMRPQMQPLSAFLDCENCPEIVVIPPGDYNMGAADDEIVTDVSHERPQHRVTIDEPFAVSRFQVTKGEFAFFVKSAGYTPSMGCQLFSPDSTRVRYPFHRTADWNSPGFAQSDRDPVVCVGWQDAHAYIAWLNSQLAGKSMPDPSGPYGLPSEAEWEYAARASWRGNDPGQNNAYCAHCGSQWRRQTAPVGSFGPNPFGLYDILGNVNEWTEDCWNRSYDQSPSDGEAWLSGNCTRRVARGGSLIGRLGLDASTPRSFTGFRVAKTLQ